MTLRTLFSVLLKLIGIFTIKDIIVAVIQLAGMYYEGAVILAVGVFTLALYYLIFHILVFKTDMVIDKLKLAENIREEEFSFFTKPAVQFNFKPVLNLALLIVSLYLFITEIPNFIRLAYMMYSKRQAYMGDMDDTGSYLALSAGKILIAYIILQTSNTIADFIDRKTKQSK